MKALLLDASPAGDARTMRAASALAEALRSRGYAVDRVVVRDRDVRACTGCFGCWVRTPGECVIDDDARDLARRAIAADVLALVTPTRFGTYGSLAKSVLDRMICLILPHFTLVDGEIHHKRRYARYPVLVALGTAATGSAEDAALFGRLVERNSVNLHNPSHAAAVVAGGENPAGAVARLLAEVRIATGVAA